MVSDPTRMTRPAKVDAGLKKSQDAHIHHATVDKLNPPAYDYHYTTEHSQSL